ncbi:Uncharacterized protein OS=Singulisphaera acidiphila (strain ATCC BAA-1392 / DSM 18658 / VKM B-2454 / MOB10) GN=Sinac_0896 PE=4 SV=1 [Gemmataceae bacterium]|nr:Uncharacterized protein OS=Singulisphaera acidiphila (strain ATCC BAA-1392 / DSM 18658 / VKM B-2454 / MOB10) GN=Sinac_0896 PE=4 SV=1 [Gemmataceae bacterium]VTU00655.1 Uncharacterized protein OS=Singulisphaera acidiphila (strain ATCC BAA-1392 / DSM 18658 / VKM B-2454 / MOB10) GN=Sinac_0896 PE=4 SV=1 [Gemmataceae bacterium]
MSPAVPSNPHLVPPQGAVAAPAPDPEIRVYGHSNLFYWWPVWALGFLFAFLTYLDGHMMAVVPAGTQVESGQVIPGHDGTPRDVLVAPPGQAVPPLPGTTNGEPEPRLRVANNNNYGVLFFGAVLLVVMVTNFLMRGLASVIFIASIIITGLVLALMGWWDTVLAFMGGLDVRINAGGYLVVAVPLFVMWLFSTFIYDHYTYLIVSRGQVRIRREIGGGEVAVDASGLSLRKERDDLFRHWLLGLGTGDLHVKTGGPANMDFELNNVLLIGTKLARIQEMLREKEVSHEVVTA